MREILFRGFHDFSKKWIYGYYNMYKVSEKNSTYHIKRQGNTWKIKRRETMGEYIGIDDIKGNKIFEDDIVRIQYPNGGDFEDTLGVVFHIDGIFMHGNQAGRPPKRMWEHCEVVGNVHEDYDMLQKNQDEDNIYKFYSYKQYMGLEQDDQ